MYGTDAVLRNQVAVAGRGFVLAVPSGHTVATVAGDRRVVDLAVRTDLSWNRIPAGHGVKGPKLFDWALIDAPDPAVTGGGYTGVLIRRTLTDGELTFYRVHAPAPVPVWAFVQVAGIRWRIEEAFASGEGTHRPGRTPGPILGLLAPLAMLAHAFLSMTALHARAQQTTDGLTPITRNEIRHLLTRALTTPLTWAFTLAWSRWRRTHQPRPTDHNPARPR